MPLLRLYLIGPPRIECDGVSVKVDTRKTLALLIFLAVTHRSHRRDSLVNLFWPESNQIHGQALLRHSLYALRKAIKGDWIKADRDIVGLNPGADLWVDVDRFDSLMAGCGKHGHGKDDVCVRCLKPLIDALELYRDDFLTGFSLKDSVKFDDWQLAQSRSLITGMTGGFARLIRCLKEQGDFTRAIMYTQRWLALDQNNESAHRQLMDLYASSGQRTAALNQYRECVRTLKCEMDVPPEKETVQLYEVIKAGRVYVESHTNHTAADIHPNNLPRQLTSFIGREQEISELKGLLSTACLLTFTGSGGCGKTRLALQVVSDVLEKYRDGVWLVELASLSDPALVAQSVASTLDVHEQPGQSTTETLLDYLRSKQMLIVLDNCEHLLQACGELAESLLHACRNLRILVTSRELLHVSGECEFLVPPLRVPQNSDKKSAERLVRYEAVRLYQERAAAVRPAFAVTNENAPAVAEICMRLDGLPLAIELAAARLKVLPTKALLKRLVNRLDVLKGGARDLPARQQTLRSEIDWSYDLLDEGEKTLFRRLSVFAGSFTLEAAETVCAVAENELDSDMLDGLTSLVDKSLLRIIQLQQDVYGEPCFQMLGTIREYANERLEENGEAESLGKRFADFFIELTEKAEPGLFGPDQRLWFERLDRDYDNIRAALVWLQNRKAVREGLRLAGALGWYWWRRGRFTEGQDWLENFLALSEGSAYIDLQAKALNYLGWIKFVQTGFESHASQDCFAESLELWRKVGDKRGLAFALSMVGFWERQHGEMTAGNADSEESVRIARDTGEPWIIAYSLRLAYSTTPRDDIDNAFALASLEEAIILARKTGDPYCLCDSIHGMGDVFRFLGDHEAAWPWFLESLKLAREMDNKFFIFHNLRELGMEHLSLGDTSKAKECFKEALQLSADLGAKGFVAEFLVYFGQVARYESDHTRAVRLFGAAETLQGAKNNPETTHQFAEKHQGTIDNLEAARQVHYGPELAEELNLNEAELSKEWAVGQGMTQEEAVAYALSNEERTT